MGKKGEETRRRIVQSAGVLFHSKGYTNTSMDDIVRETKITKGNLYYHFPSKEDLGHAVVDQAIAEQFGANHDSEDCDPIRGILAMFHRVEKSLTEGRCRGGCLFGNLALEVSDLHDGLRQKLDLAFSNWEDRIEHRLQSGKRAGVFSAALQPKATAHFIIAALEGGTLLAKVKRDVRALKSCTVIVRGLLESFRA